MSVVVRQQGAGNGKSYELIRSILAGDADAIVLTKPHTNKDMLYAEIMAAATTAHARSKNRAWIVGFHGTDGVPRRAIFATVDSFMFAIGDPTRGGRAFDSAVRSVDEEQLARSVPRDEDGAWLTFKGERVRVDRSVVLVDEAQDLGLEYVRALEAYARHTESRVVLIGDKLQSIQHEENAFTASTDYEFEPARNVCRRFGPRIASFVNRLIFHDEANARWTAGLAPITTLDTAPSEGTVTVTKVPSAGRGIAEKTVERVMDALSAEVALHPALRPNDVLVVAPFVRNYAAMEALEMRLSEFWAERGVADAAYLHVSEPGHPVNLEHSRDATRLVSIHASKGDGRRVVFVVGLTEAALSRFSDTEVPSESLIYLSLLHVALTRAVRSMHVFLHDLDDDVTRRFVRAGVVADDWITRPAAAWPACPTLLRDTINSSTVSAMLIQSTLASIIALAPPTEFIGGPSGPNGTGGPNGPSGHSGPNGTNGAGGAVSDAVHHYIEYSCMVVGAIMHVVDTCRTRGGISGLFCSAQSRIRAAVCVDMTPREYATKYIFGKPRADRREADRREAARTERRETGRREADRTDRREAEKAEKADKTDRREGARTDRREAEKPDRPESTDRREGASTDRTDRPVVPIVHGPRAARLRELVERVKTLDRPVTPLDMCVTLYILGHTYPNMIDRTRGMYRPFSMYRVIGWFDRARARTDAEWGQHSARLARLECLMRAAVEFAGDTAWLIDYCKPYRLSPVDEFELTAQHGVLFRFDRADGVAYVVHLVCRFHADPYAHSIDALVDTITNERKEGKDSACLVIALDCAAPFVVRPPSDQRAILEYTRLAMRAHYARLNAEIARGIVKKRIPLYAERAIARGATDPASLDRDLDAAIEAYVNEIFVRSTTVFVTDVADYVPDETYESEPVAPVFAPYTGPVLSRAHARACGERAPILAFGGSVPNDVVDEPTAHAANAARAALDAFCVAPRAEVPLSVQHHDNRTLIGRADVIDSRGVAVEFKLRVGPTALRQVSCYLAMMMVTDTGGRTGGPATGYVVGLHDGEVHRVVVRDPVPIITACFRF
jgi:hypothetical protein